MGLTYDDATRVLEAALAKADEIGCAMSVAIVDGSRELLAFARQDGAVLVSAQVAINKAWTAKSMDMPTGDIGPLTQPGQPLYQFEHAADRPIITFAGGRPIVVDGVVVGAIGVSGGAVDQDDSVARTGAESVTAGVGR
jgi:uncharacterized protein GlcG (DUF336 family)